MSKKQVANGGAGGRQGLSWEETRFHPQSLCNLWDENWKGGEKEMPLQYSCLDNPMNRGALSAIVHGVARVEHDWVHACAHTHTHRKGSLKSEFTARKSDISLSEPPAALTWTIVEALSPFNSSFLTQILLKLKGNHVIFSAQNPAMAPWVIQSKSKNSGSPRHHVASIPSPCCPHLPQPH